MSNSNLDYWDVDGQSLNTYAFNITTIGGDRVAPPRLRGGNLTIPYAVGQTYMPKVVDQKTMTLAFWVIGADENGDIPTNRDMAAMYDTNYRKLRNLFWTPNREFVLTKRFYIDGVLKTASAKAQFSSGLVPTMNGRARAVFTVDFVLADPYFYTPIVSTTLTTGTVSLTVEGDDITRAITAEFAGARQFPKIKNNTLNVEFEYYLDLSSGDTAVVDVKKFKSTTTPSGVAAFTSSASIRHSGSPFWMELNPGVNSLTLSSLTGIGVVTLKHQAVWL